MSALLSVEDLHVRYAGPDRKSLDALCGVHLQLAPGETLGLLGESGSGKSTLARALLRMLPRTAQVPRGEIEFAGQKLFQLGEREITKIRGAQISLISQDPGLALNPVLKVGDQIAEVLRAHRKWRARQCRSEAEALLERVHLRAANRRIYDAYPHQLSGGQQQRVVIAQALACNPLLIIADEPTASLDSGTQAEILEMFSALQSERKTSLILITHDPAILPGLADRVAVLYAGRVVEDSPCDLFFQNAMHPYAKGLLSCMPPLGASRQPGFRLTTIAGSAPGAERLPDGCSFSPRCADRLDKCKASRPVSQVKDNNRRVECFLYD